MEGKRNGILSKRQNRPRENRADGRKGGDGWKYANLTGLRERRMKAGSRIFATLCRPTSDAVRTDAAPASAKREKKLAKRQSGFARGKPPIRRKKSTRSPVFPRFPHSREFLCGKKFASLRQEINFFQQRNPVFAARKSPPRRRNAPCGQFPRPFFNTSGSISSLPSRRTDAGEGGEHCTLTEKPWIWRHSGTGAAAESPNGPPPRYASHKNSTGRTFPVEYYHCMVIA